MASPNIGDMITTTMRNRSTKLADNLTNNNALLRRLRQKGNVRTFSGGTVIDEALMFNDPNTKNVGAYSGYDVIDITPNSPITAAQFLMKLYAASVTISGHELLQNSGKERVIDLLESRIRVAEGQLQNEIASDLYGDGTGFGGKAITGLGVAISTSPTSGTYGGIDRAAWSFWRNKAFSAVADGGAAATAANIQGYMNALSVRLVRGRDKPDLIVADNNYYNLYQQSLQAIQRVTSDEHAGAGFVSLKYYGAGLNSDVILDGGIYDSSDSGMPENTMYFLNTNYLFFRPHAERNFQPIGNERESVNQDAIVRLFGWAGNLTCSGAQFQGVLFEGA